ncbi:MAG TPA: ATP-dependent DNA helicase [Candidatus Saccharimonadales bacterium]|nr:ATP-dependent DNA helicase [Candidatus Saccharimonadales bacterium]
MEENFKKALAGLNERQLQAVKTIDGPVLVIAGPGTGKTELLALRAAQILHADNTMLPGNILCLTFTDSAANNMRERLVRYIGQDAYRIGIHTFNSFGSYVVNAYPEFFYEWREIRTADELTTYRLIENLLAALPGDHPLAGHNLDGQFYAHRQIRNLIGDAKRAALTPDDLRRVLEDNRRACERLLPIIRRHWPPSMGGAKSLEATRVCVEEVAKLAGGEGSVLDVVPFDKMVIQSLQDASAKSEQLEKRGRSKPFTAWKTEWLEKNADNELIFKAQKHHKRLLAAIDIYERYEQELASQGLMDFNDQIMQVLTAMREHSELRFNLQERFQYIMIDEFQDTNRSQLLMARYLTDAPVHEGRPNILAVGDDDQAIFRFQGADISNVEQFEADFQKLAEIVLTVNYRSNRQILDGARAVAGQIELSLAQRKTLDKRLSPTVEKTGDGLIVNEFDYEGSHYSYIAERIGRLLRQGVPGDQIAVLARERPQLDRLVPYLRNLKIPINYERRENILEKEHIVVLLDMARLVQALAEQDLQQADASVAQVLSSPMWGLQPADIWSVASQAYREHRLWLDVIEERSGRIRQIVDFFINLGLRSASIPMEQVLDELIGTGPTGAESEQDDDARPSNVSFFSPFKDYYFGQEILQARPAEYLALLSHLSTLRGHLRNYQADTSRTLYLKDLLEFVDAYKRSDNLTMLDQSPHNEDARAVQLMTIHKAKGLEFDNVFVVGLQNDVWTRSGSHGRFSYPPNLRTIRPSENQDDDGLRLLFVAMTRARQSLHLNYYLKDEQGNAAQPYGPLLALTAKPRRPAAKDDTPSLVAQYEQRWLTAHGSVDGGELRAFFNEQLERYKLSATDFNNFLDVSLGGPDYFFTHNLLHFPSGKIPAAIYGNLVHSAFAQAHAAALSGAAVDPERIISNFEAELDRQPLSETEKQSYRQRGRNSLKAYFDKSGDEFTDSQVADVNFKDQDACLDDVRLQGSIDRLDLDKKSKTAVISDYKTGAPETSWQLPPKAEEYRKIKMHRYRNQLLFYKLLLDHGADWGERGWKANSALLRFAEPDNYGRIRLLELPYAPAEIARFEKLVRAVWKRIQKLDFPDISAYPKSLEGILGFEADLIDGETKTPD